METILIPPIPELNWAAGRPFHLLLAHLIDDRDYWTFYRQEKDDGAYLILDNSAHEFSVGKKMSSLFYQALGLSADEIVIPDALFDAKRTTDQASEALSWLCATPRVLDDLAKTRINFMLVPQGRTGAEYDECLKKLLTTYALYQRRYPECFPPPVIGISKDYETFKGGLMSIVDRIIGLKQHLQLQVHLLGWGRDLLALQIIANLYGDQIRTVDSAKPFVYGMVGIKLDGEENPIYPKRPEKYFEMSFEEQHRESIRHNIEIFEKAASGRIS
jgi:hypothetical protein